MFYEILFQSCVLARVAAPAVTYQEGFDHGSMPADQEVRWLQPSLDQEGRYRVRPISFWTWLTSSKLRCQSASSVEVDLQGYRSDGLWSRFRSWIFGINTSFYRPHFPHVYSAELLMVRKQCRALPPLTVHEDTRCGVHRSFDLGRYETRSLAVLGLEPLKGPSLLVGVRPFASGEESNPSYQTSVVPRLLAM